MKKKVVEEKSELDDLRELQENRYNPGYYIGTGKVSKPISNLSKHPWLFIIWGILSLIPGFIQISYIKIDIESLSNTLIPMILSFGFGIALIYGGVIRIIKNKKTPES